MQKISGIVVKGDGYGRKLGYPTANLDNPHTELKAGVYAGTASFVSNVSKRHFDTYRAGILINPDGKTEAHLLGFEGDLYGKMLTLEIAKFLREYKKFESEAELINQIKKDLEQC